MLVGLHVPTNFQMYRQNSEKALLGGGGGQFPLPPPPPSGYANDLYSSNDVIYSEVAAKADGKPRHAAMEAASMSSS